MPLEQIIAFFVFAVAAAVTPGPSNVMVMAAGARGGIAGGIPCVMGVVAGMAMLMGAAGLGSARFVQACPQALVLLKWSGAAFLLWLAWKVASAPPLSGRPEPEPVGFWAALAFQWINPKSWIVAVSAASTYGAQRGAAPGTQAATLALVFALAALPSCAVWLAFGATMQRWLVDERRSRLFSVATGAALAASVVLVVR